MKNPFSGPGAFVIAVCIASPLVSLLVLTASSRLTQSEIRFDVGPNTGRYLRGFTESEERPPVSFRWSGERAFISLPFRAEGKPRLEFRVARFLPATARVHWSLNGERARTIDVRSGRFRNVVIELEPTTDAPLNFELVVEDPDATQLGVCLDWFSVNGLTLRPDPGRWASWAAPLLTLGILVVAALCGLDRWTLVGVGALSVVSTSVWFCVDPMGMMHSLPRLLVGSLILASGTAVWIRARLGVALAGLVLISFLARGAAIMHPSYFYPDVRNHRRYVTALVQASGSWVDRGLSAQKTVRTAYPRKILGRDYALPYSPLFFVPFTAINGERAIEQALKLATLVFAALEIPLVFAVARRLWGTRTALIAAAILALFPPMTSRLALAMFPTIAGHVFEMAAMALALSAAGRWQEPRHLLRYAGAGLLASLTYVTSLINLSLFTLTLAVGLGRDKFKLLAAWTVVGVVTVGLLYLPFLSIAWFEILPQLLHPPAQTPSAGTVEAQLGLISTLARAPLFYGWLALALALVGGLLSIRDKNRHWIAAYAGTAMLLMGMRAFSGGLFKDLKEILFAAPLVAMLAARAIHEIMNRRHWGPIAAGGILAGLIIWVLNRFASEFSRLTSLAGSG